MAVLELKEVTVKQYGKTILDRITFAIDNGEQWAITGPSGSGKTTLLKALCGKQYFNGQMQISDKHPSLSRRIILVEQQHHFKNLSNTSDFYYQQRFNSGDSEDAITVAEDLQHAITRHAVTKDKLDELVELFGIKRLFNERLIQLSNGENKRLQIVKALLLEPLFLLLDNPFTGLDVESRKILENLLAEVAKKGVHIVMVAAGTNLPFFITNVLTLSANGTYKVFAKTAQWNDEQIKKQSSLSLDRELLLELTSNGKSDLFEFAVRMKDVTIKYDHTILDKISWEVKNGEKWSLSGPNGSGKSTLLSLVNADNPQAYANEIYLFDRRRGTGESIWDIKKKTGFISPELHLYFEKGTNCFDVVASGLFDTIGLFRKLNEQQKLIVGKWMRLLKIENLSQKLLFQLSNSQQRLVLLTRALVKNPPLLILDEPCQGLEEEQTNFFKTVINEISVTANKTLIYVSHYAHEIPECVSHFIKLENGKRVE